MAFPTTRKGLVDAGYSFNTRKMCPCGARMELWNTPKGAQLPMEPMAEDESEAKAHFATCPLAAQFRRKK